MLAVFESVRGGKKNNGLFFCLSVHSDDPTPNKLKNRAEEKTGTSTPLRTHERRQCSRLIIEF